MHKICKNVHKRVIFYVKSLHICAKCRYFARWEREIYLVLFILILKIMSEIEAKVKEIIVDKLGVDEAEVTPEASEGGISLYNRNYSSHTKVAILHKNLNLCVIL